MLQVLLALLSPTVAVMIAFLGLRRADRAERLRIFFDLQERYLSEPVRRGRGLVHRIKVAEPGDMADHDQHELSAIGYALAVMNSIAICCEGGYVDEVLVRRSIGRSFVEAIRAAQPYIDYVESVRGFRPYQYAERLGARLSRVSLPSVSADSS